MNVRFVLAAILGIGLGWMAPAQSADTAEPEKGQAPASSSAAKKSEYPAINDLTSEAEKTEGFLTLYRKKDNLYAEIPGSSLDKPFLLSMSLSRGVGQGMLVSGMMSGESIFYWKAAENRVFLVEKNVRHTSKPGTPISNAVRDGFSDSIIAAFPIRAKTGGTYLIDLGDFLFTDYPMLGQQLARFLGGGYSLDRSRTVWGKIKGFPENTNVEVAATYAGGAGRDLRTVPDSRAVPLSIFYSFSKIPETGFRPRTADDRMGYFLTARKDYSQEGPEEPFVRYINRWHLEKADPSAEFSPPKKPIVFHIEKSVPYEYRPIVREGILEWNKAFRKAGIIDAIEVRYQEDDATWDAEDVRYNTVRWMTGEMTFAIGPSRTNPETGEIYDADILIDASFIKYYSWDYDVYGSAAMLTQEPDADTARDDTALDDYLKTLRERVYGPLPEREPLPQAARHCRFAHEYKRELGLAALTVAGGDEAAAPEALIQQALKDLIMHEVGHTLGLRHNFKASSVVPLADLNNKAKTADSGLSGSVMDYNPMNIAPPGVPQGDYASRTLGPWDYLAIEYGYRQPVAGKENEKDMLKAIAAKTAEPQFAYATDEDVSRDIDPYANRWDAGDDPLAYARQRVEIVTHLWPGLVDRVVKEGEGYQNARRAFLYSLGDMQQRLYHAARFVGGYRMSRVHKGDSDTVVPLQPVAAAKQREALDLLAEYAFSGGAFQTSPALMQRLAPNWWNHWGSDMPFRVEVPVQDLVLMGQLEIIARLFSPAVLARVAETPTYTAAPADLVTVADVYGSTMRAIWAEVYREAPGGAWSDATPMLSTARRNVQRTFLRYVLIADAVTPMAGLPQDAQPAAWSTLVELDERLTAFLEDADQTRRIDSMSLAHLREASARIKKALDAAFMVPVF